MSTHSSIKDNIPKAPMQVGSSVTCIHLLTRDQIFESVHTFLVRCRRMAVRTIFIRYCSHLTHYKTHPRLISVASYAGMSSSTVQADSAAISDVPSPQREGLSSTPAAVADPAHASCPSQHQEPKSKKQKKGNDRKKKNFRTNRKNDGNGDGDEFESRYPVDKTKRIHPGSYAHEDFRTLMNLPSLPPVPPHTEAAKRKVAMLIAYKGTNYGGFQINEGKRTLQSEIEFALYKNGFLRFENFGAPQKYGWSTSGRTDKGVHAAAQTISCKIELGPSDTMDVVRDKMNTALQGTDITVIAVERTTRMFCAKRDRNRVRYRYLIPSFVFTPNMRPVLEQIVKYPENEQHIGNPVTPDEIQALWPYLKDTRIGREQLDLLTTTLASYAGTHCFHNFTKGVLPTEGRARRYIVSFQVHDPVVDKNGIEWIPTAVHGQSFLLHQIRKMVAVAMDVVRGAAPAPTYPEAAFSPLASLRLPVAPATGLFLEMSNYDTYNTIKQQRANHGTTTVPDLVWDATEGPLYDRWSECVRDIQDHIMQEEFETGNFIQHMYTQEFINDTAKSYPLVLPSEPTDKTESVEKIGEGEGGEKDEEEEEDVESN